MFFLDAKIGSFKQYYITITNLCIIIIIKINLTMVFLEAKIGSLKQY